MDAFLELLASNSLTRLVLFPTLAALPLLFLRRDQVVKPYLLVVSLIEMVLTFVYLSAHRGGDGIFTLSRDLGPDGKPLAWIPSFGIRWDLVADGISWPLAVLTVILLPIIFLGTWNAVEKRWAAYGASMLVLTSGVLGALFAFDLFVFYIFWEVMLIPMYLIIGIWGGERRVYAAVKFFLFTMAGSLLMLIAILWLAATFHSAAGVWSFAYEDFLRLDIPIAAQVWLFAGFALAFLIKVPVFPLHTWLPDAHFEAPTGGSVVLAGVLLKLGTYGYLRFALPLFPHASDELQPVVLTLSVIGILYGALVAWAQEDMKKLVAYSSVAHLGFVMLGLVAVDLIAWQGALIQMINHGLSTGALFLLVGMLYERRHTKAFAEFGGLAKVMPMFAFFLVFSTLASVGLPALNGFVGEFLILLGAYRTLGFWAIVSTFGVVLAAIYLLKMLQLTIWGPITKEVNKGLKDLSPREILTLAPLAVLMLAIGVAPAWFLEPSQKALEATLAQYKQRLAAPAPAQVRLVNPLHEAAAQAAAGGSVEEVAR
jgi:NADH-quinone oxidoreductase subunit M